MSSAKIIAKNALANGTGLICEAVISFCMLPYILHRLGESAYGVWAFTIAISGYMGILNLGFRPAINKYVAEYNVTGNWQKIRDLLQASLFSYSACAICILIACGTLAYNISRLFNVPPEFQSTASVLILLVGVQMASGLIAVVFGGVISGLQRYEINNGIEICVMLSRTAIIVLFLEKFPSLFTLAAAHFSMTILGYLATVVIARRIADISPLNLFRLPDRLAIKTILAFSAITFVISTAGRIIMYIDSPLIAAILTTQAVTFYTIGSRLIKYLNNLVEVLMNVLAPATSDLYARNKLDTIKDIFLYSSKMSCLVVFPVVIFLFFWGEEFFYLWLGKEYPESYMVMCVLGVGSLFYLPQLSTIPILFGTAKHKLVMYLAIVSGVISVVTAVSFGEIYGLTGIAVGLGIPQALLYWIFCPLYVTRLLKLTYWRWFYETYIKVCLISIPYVSFHFACKQIGKVDNWYVFLLIVFGAATIYSFCAWFFVINKEEKKQLIGIISNFGLYKAKISK